MVILQYVISFLLSFWSCNRLIWCIYAILIYHCIHIPNCGLINISYSHFIFWCSIFDVFLWYTIKTVLIHCTCNACNCVGIIVFWYSLASEHAHQYQVLWILYSLDSIDRAYFIDVMSAVHTYFPHFITQVCNAILIFEADDLFCWCCFFFANKNRKLSLNELRNGIVADKWSINKLFETTTKPM